MSHLISKVVFLALFLRLAEAACPPPIPPGSSWVASPGCSGVYTTATSRCHCWGHCGYICDPIAGTTAAPTTASPTCNRPQLTPSQSWVPGPGCSGVYTTATTRCHCWGHCGYICDPIAPTAAPTTVRPTTTTPCVRPQLTPRQSWVPSPGCSGVYTTATTRCHCWGHCGYICDPISAPTARPTTSRPRTTTKACARPPLSPGQTWVSSPGCSGTYDTATQHCHCFAHCGYKCDPLPPRTTTRRPTTARPTTTVRPATTAASCRDPPASAIPAGSTYYRSPGCPLGTNIIKTSPGPRSACHCTYHCGYICTPITTGTTVAPGTTTMGGSTGTTTVSTGSTTATTSTGSTTASSTTGSTSSITTGSTSSITTGSTSSTTTGSTASTTTGSTASTTTGSTASTTTGSTASTTTSTTPATG